MLRKVVVLKSWNKVENNLSSHLVTLSEQRALGQDLLFPAKPYHFTSAKNLAFSLKRVKHESCCIHLMRNLELPCSFKFTGPSTNATDLFFYGGITENWLHLSNVGPEVTK